ncbi:MAG: septation protein A [Polycyclovorans sp.]|jgi:intracellular septation protein|nr:septation protein A [Polycyclovorans sp.]MEC8850248.1 inner membrane-spanning protein YciB [Pseudomonadota bacterium]|tara:strand:- start:15922 stop:16464 length:543 start_codon:yes stop_codon:yes gene_type:complete
MKHVLDLGPAVAFFVAYYLGDIYTATLTVIIALFVTVAGYGLLERRLHKLHLAAAMAALVFGGLTLYVRDPTFIKFKPTMMYALLGLVLLGSHWIGDRVLLQRLPQTVVALPETLWRRLNAVWGAFFLALAGLNLLVASQFSEEVWVQFRTYGYSIITFVFLLAQLPFLTKYMPQQADKP